MENTMPNSPQKFAISHLREEEFRADGLRPYAEYRDLGFAEATNGMVQAHVIRHAPGFTAADRVSNRHYHEVEFQMIYCLKGWMKSEFEGQGVVHITTGTSWIQPSGIKHKVLEMSEDMELLEIILPAKFD